MGQEINSSNFQQRDFEQFHLHLVAETRLLGEMLRGGRLDSSDPVAGYELEAWLIDAKGNPAPRNARFLQALADPDVVAELATFNVELNGPPEPLAGHALSRMQQSLEANWLRCRRMAESMGLQLLATGILPTIRPQDLILENMSQLKRYIALNQQILRLRGGRPIELHIEGDETLSLRHDDVMLESATTSFQIHLQVDADLAARYYNAAKIASAAIVAVSANSPFLFGGRLWEETRIPLFEQAVSVGASDRTNRVSFGFRYIEKSIFEVFESNLERYPVLLPMLSDDDPQRLSHLRLHNGTIWRWNRPLIGFSADGQPHIRIEHRVVPAGPTHVDQFANAAFFYGLVNAFANAEVAPEARLPFSACRSNFYHAAKKGMHAEVEWLDGECGSLKTLCLEVLLDQAQEGLALAGVDHHEAAYYLDVIRQRLQTGQTGAAWQKKWVDRHGPQWQDLTLSYAEHQQSAQPVHRWSL
ncbi:MAG TPA: glutamate--cysteine ligase [Gammaproteobacteria bacterium]|nr:glutamate--cysteine ligase [Gammaproteobacteria bacterium]